MNSEICFTAGLVAANKKCRRCLNGLHTLDGCRSAVHADEHELAAFRLDRARKAARAMAEFWVGAPMRKPASFPIASLHQCMKRMLEAG